MGRYNVENFPGFNVVRTYVFMVYLILFIGYFSLSSFPEQIGDLWINITIVALLVAVVLCLISATLVHTVIFLKIRDLKAYKLYLPKILVDSAVFLFFAIICFWIFYLRGIINSPLSGLLTISPLFFIIQIISRQQLVNHIEEYFANKPEEDEPEVVSLERSLNLLRRTYGLIIFSVSIASLIVVVLTITVVERLLAGISEGAYPFLQIATVDCSVFKSGGWFIFTSYFVFYVSILSAVIAMIPYKSFMRVSKKLFF